MYLIDTSVWIDFIRGQSNPAVERLRMIWDSQQTLGIASVIYQEILQGSDSERSYHQFRDFFSVLPFYHPKDHLQSHEQTAQLYFSRRRQGVTIRSTIDCPIAATLSLAMAPLGARASCPHASPTSAGKAGIPWRFVPLASFRTPPHSTRSRRLAPTRDGRDARAPRGAKLRIAGLIAQIAMAHQLVLVHNGKDFERIAQVPPRLKLQTESRGGV